MTKIKIDGDEIIIVHDNKCVETKSNTDSNFSYTIKELGDSSLHPVEVQVSFLLSSPDWYELESSAEWSQIIKILGKFQNR